MLRSSFAARTAGLHSGTRGHTDVLRSTIAPDITLGPMKIPALRIEVNGELVAVAGAKELSLLSGQVGFGAGKGGILDASHVMFSVMGIDVQAAQPRQLTWGNAVQLKMGDRVTFQVTEVEQPSEPDQVVRTPSATELASAAAREEKRRPSRSEPEA